MLAFWLLAIIGALALYYLRKFGIPNSRNQRPSLSRPTSTFTTALRDGAEASSTPGRRHSGTQAGSTSRSQDHRGYRSHKQWYAFDMRGHRGIVKEWQQVVDLARELRCKPFATGKNSVEEAASHLRFI